MANKKCNCGTCKRCLHRVYMNEWYRKPGSAERAREWAKRYRENNLETVREYDRRRRRRLSPERVIAHNKVRHAIEAGKLTRQACEVCGQPPIKINNREIVHAHHHDYEKPLEIRWLCRTCHGLEHRQS